MAYFRCGKSEGGGTIGGTATAADIADGKTITLDGDTVIEGEMPNRGSVSETLDCGESYTVPAGQHSGSGTVSANSLASQTGVDSGKSAIDAAHVANGYQGWVNGQKISGEAFIPSGNVSQTFTLSGSAEVDNGSGQLANLTFNFSLTATYNPTTGQITLSKSGSATAKAYSWASGWQGPATASSAGSIS